MRLPFPPAREHSNPRRQHLFGSNCHKIVCRFLIRFVSQFVIMPPEQKAKKRAAEDNPTVEKITWNDENYKSLADAIMGYMVDNGMRDCSDGVIGWSGKNGVVGRFKILTDIDSEGDKLRAAFNNVCLVVRSFSSITSNCARHLEPATCNV
jgi:hypothetical protein